MSPRTNSPTLSLYEMYDDTTAEPPFNFNNNNKNKDNNNKLKSQNYFSYSPSYSSSPSIPPPPTPTPSTKNINITCINKRDIRRNTNNGANPNDNSGSINALLPWSPKIVFSSAIIQFFSLMMVYSFCITALWMVFCTSYLLTFYDDTRNVFHTSRVWARVKDGVRERISMFGNDWEELFQKYFDQRDGVDGNKNGHLGGGLNNNNNAGDNNNNSNDNSEDADWEEWLKSRMFKLMTAVAGPNVADKFKQSASTCQSQQHKK